MKGYVCDGLDILDVYQTAQEAVASARNGEPAFIEARTYRYKGHSMSDPQKYRTREEVDAYKQRDAILLLKSRLEAANMLSQEDWDTIVALCETAVDEAVNFAEKSPEPAPGELFTDIFA